MNIAILTDTNSGITAVEALENGIFVMPMPVIIDGVTYYEGKTLTEEEFFQALTSGKDVSTSMPAPSEVLDEWDKLLELGYDQIVYIPMSSGLSSSCETAMAFSHEYEGKVFVVDNHRISVTLRQSVVKAKHLAEVGMSGDEIKSLLEREAYNSTIYVSVNTLEFLKKGGRITPAAAAIGAVLNIKPVLSIQGEKLDSFAKIRGSMKKCEEKMISACKDDIKRRFPDAKPEQLHIGGAGAGLTKEEIDQWMTMLKTSFPGSNLFYNPLSASISTHTGVGAVGVGISVDTD